MSAFLTGREALAHPLGRQYVSLDVDSMGRSLTVACRAILPAGRQTLQDIERGLQFASRVKVVHRGSYFNALLVERAGFLNFP